MNIFDFIFEYIVGNHDSFFTTFFIIILLYIFIHNSIQFIKILYTIFFYIHNTQKKIGSSNKKNNILNKFT